MRPIGACLLVFMLPGCSGSETTPAVSSIEDAEQTEAAAVDAYRVSRDQICTEASDDVAEINAKWIDAKGATSADVIKGLKLVLAQGDVAREQLQAIPVPGSLVAFAASDDAARDAGQEVLRTLIQSLEDGEDLDAAVAEADVAETRSTPQGKPPRTSTTSCSAPSPWFAVEPLAIAFQQVGHL